MGMKRRSSLTVKEVAEILRIRPETVRHHARKGSLSHEFVAGKYLFDRAAVEGFKKSPAHRTRRRVGYTPATSFRLDPQIIQLATLKAGKLGVSRSKYVEILLRKDLGLGGIDLQELEHTSVFG